MNAKHSYCSEVVLSCKSLLWQQLISAIKNRGILPLKVLSSVETPYFHNSVDKKNYIWPNTFWWNLQNAGIGSIWQIRLWVSIKKCCELSDWWEGMTCGRIVTNKKFLWCDSHKFNFLIQIQSHQKFRTGGWSETSLINTYDPRAIFVPFNILGSIWSFWP